MQRGFTKLFNTIVTSTIWQEPDATRIVWITMLAISDQYGVVSASLPGLASVSHITLERCAEAVKTLESPDEYSRTQLFDGRRIQPTEGGWLILNYVKYREMLSQEERKEYKAKWARSNRRQKRGQKSTNVDNVDEQGRTKTITSASASASCFLDRIKSDSLYQGIEIDRELENAKRWCKKKNRRLTQRFFENWLKRADRLLPLPQPKSKYLPPRIELTDEQLRRNREVVQAEKAKLRQHLKL